MKRPSFSLIGWVMVTAFIGPSLFAQMSIEQAVTTFDSETNHFNILTYGDTTLTNTHTDGAVATRGNLNLSGDTVLAMHSSKLDASMPSVYVRGNLVLSNAQNGVKLNNGTAYIPNYSNTTKWYGSGENSPKLQAYGSSSYLALANSSTTLADLTTAPASSWAINTALTSLSQASIALAQAAATGTVSINSNNLILTTSVTEGVAIFNLDASALSFSGVNIQLSVPDDVFYVVNVFNADGTTLFNGANGNGDSDSASRLLWNIVADSNPATNSTVNMGSNLYGSILAPMMDITSNGRYMNGQIVANSFSQSGAEVHHVAVDASFVSFTAVPEPANWGVLAIAAACVGHTLRRRRRLTA